MKVVGSKQKKKMIQKRTKQNMFGIICHGVWKGGSTQSENKKNRWGDEW